MKDPLRWRGGSWAGGLLLLAGCAVGGGSDRGPAVVDAAAPPALRAIAEPPAGKANDADVVVAVVNGKPLTHGEIYVRVLRRFGAAKFLSDMIMEEIVAQEAEKRGVKVTAEEIDSKVDEQLAAQAAKAGSKEELAAGYEKVGLKLDDLRRSLASETASALLLRKLVKSMRTIDDGAVNRYYKSFYSQTRYQMRHIAYSFRPQRPDQTEADKARLKLEAYNRALRTAEKIRNGGDFGAIARAESDDMMTASRGGELGSIPNDPDAGPPFMRPVFSLKANEVSQPIENPEGGYHIFQVTAILPGESFLDCKDKIVRELRDREPDAEEMQNALMALRRSADVQYKGDAVSDLAAPGTGRP